MKDYPSQRITSRLSCREVSACASDYLDDHLPLLLRLRTGLHLASCADCCTYLTQIALIAETCNFLPKHVPSPTNHLRIRRHFLARHTPRASTPPLRY